MTPRRRPPATAQASTDAATHDTGSVGRPVAMWWGVSTQAVARMQPNATARSADSSGQPRRDGSRYASVATPVQTVSTPRTAQPPSGCA
ncbi:hypothetical protein amrb99_85000 [Actinomadura sp. RB99]|nr:hypothetical protein [Actinomadura sp. RB99]